MVIYTQGISKTSWRIGLWKKEYVNDKQLQIAMTEYRNLKLDNVARTPNNEKLGTVTQVYNNTTGAGEQVYAVVKKS